MIFTSNYIMFTNNVNRGEAPSVFLALFTLNNPLYNKELKQNNFKINSKLS